MALTRPPSTVPATPPTKGGKLNDLATVAPKAANVAGEARLATGLACEDVASIKIMFCD